MKTYEVKLEIEAQSKEAIEAMLDRMPHADRIWEEEIIDPEERHFEYRIRYVEDWNGKGEHFLFENRWSDEKWGLDTAFKLIDDRLSFEALMKIRELVRFGTQFHFE